MIKEVLMDISTSKSKIPKKEENFLLNLLQQDTKTASKFIQILNISKKELKETINDKIKNEKEKENLIKTVDEIFSEIQKKTNPKITNLEKTAKITDLKTSTTTKTTFKTKKTVTNVKLSTTIIKKEIISKINMQNSIEEQKIIKEIKNKTSIKDLIKFAQNKLNLTKFSISQKKQPPLKTPKAEIFTNLTQKKPTKIDYKLTLKSKSEKNTKIPKLSELINQPLKKETHPQKTINSKTEKFNKTTDDTQKISISDIIKNTNIEKNKKPSKINISNQNPKPQPTINQTNNFKTEPLKTENFKEFKTDINTSKTVSNLSDKPKEFKDSDSPILPQTTNIHTFINHKILNAKESLKHFANNLKEAIDNYKPPISKVSLELNPKELGKVEITLIHRGDNLQIQVNGQNHTIGFFNQYQSDLKAVLVNMGYSDVNMSFNQNQNQQHQQKHQKYKQNQNYLNKDDEMIIEVPFKYA